MLSFFRSHFSPLFISAAVLLMSGNIYAEPQQNNVNVPSAATNAASNDSTKSQQDHLDTNPESAPVAQNPALPKGFDASADQVWSEIKTQIAPLIESCGGDGLTSMGFDLYFDAKGNIFRLLFTYSVEDGKGSFPGDAEFKKHVSSLQGCIGNKLSKYKFNIDVTNDVIELFSQKGNKVVSRVWYGEYSFGYRYDEHRLVGVTSYNIGRESSRSKYWKCRKSGCLNKLNDKLVPNKNIELMKSDIVELMHHLPADYQTIMAPENRLTAE